MNDYAHISETEASRLAARIRRLSKPLRPGRRDITPKLQPLPGIRSVLFSVYGTLLISENRNDWACRPPGAAAAFGAALRAAGFRKIAPKLAAGGPARLSGQIRRHIRFLQQHGVKYPEVDLVGIWRALLTDGLEKGLLAGSLSLTTLHRAAVEYECRLHPAWPMPHVEETLDALRAHRLKIGLVSNAQFFTPLQIQGLFGKSLGSLGIPPHRCVWSYDMGIAKPSPALVQRALLHLRHQYGILAEATLVVGCDPANDLKPARDLGCRTAFFMGSTQCLASRKKPASNGFQPDLVLTDLAQLPACVLGNGNNH